MSRTARAEQLLLGNINPAWREPGYERIYVKGGTTGRTYLVRNNAHVQLVGVCGFCCSFGSMDYWLPDDDCRLGMVLYVQHHERHFLRRANPIPTSGVAWLRVMAHYLRAGVITPGGLSVLVVLLSCAQLGWMIAKHFLQ